MWDKLSRVANVFKSAEICLVSSITKSKSWVPKWARGVCGFIIAIAALGWVVRSVDIDKVLEIGKDYSASHLVAVLLLTTTSYLLRAWRWPFFFARGGLRFKDSYRCLIMGFFMNNVLPARIGEFVRAHLGGRASSHSRTTVLATIAAERLMDGLAVSAIFCGLFLFASTPAERAEGQLVLFVSYLFGMAAVLTLLCCLFQERLLKLLEKFGRFLPGHYTEWGVARAGHFFAGLKPLFTPSKGLLLTVQSLLIWFVELSVFWQVSETFHQPMSLGALGLFLAAVNFSSLVPGPPGGIGVIEAFATAALVHIGISGEKALVMVVTQHIMQIGVVGIPGAFFLATHWGEKLAPPDEE